MNFKEHLQNDLENVIFNPAEFAEATSFTPSGSSSVESLSAIWSYLDSDDVRLPEASGEARHANVSFIRSKLSREPGRGDKLVNAKGEVFIVLNRVSADDMTAAYRAVEQVRSAFGSIMERLSQ